MQVTRSESDFWTRPRYAVRNGRGQFLDNLSSLPKLNEIREVSKKYGDPLDRLDLWDVGFDCSICGTDIDGRFSAEPTGNLLCWDCAMGRATENDLRGVSQTSDPTKAVLSESALNHKNLCDYVINVATGCTHGCKFCYVPSTPNIKMRGDMLDEHANVKNPQLEWGSYLLYRDDLPERLARKLRRKRTWNETPDGRGVVMISSGTDCYQDRRAAQITRECVIELVRHQKLVRILTRSPAVVRDLDVFEAANGLVTVGASIPCLDDEMVRAIEPGAPVPSSRLRALEHISDSGVPVYVSMSPTYPTQDRGDLRELLGIFKERLDPDVVFHEPINPRGANFEMLVEAAREAGQGNLADKLDSIRNQKTWVDYSVKQLTAVEELGVELDIPVHLWPDKALINHIKGRDRVRLESERERMDSPESYPKVPTSA